MREFWDFRPKRGRTRPGLEAGTFSFPGNGHLRDTEFDQLTKFRLTAVRTCAKCAYDSERDMRQNGTKLGSVQVPVGCA